MQGWGKRVAIRAVLIAGALTTIATSNDYDEHIDSDSSRATERGLQLTIHMNPELMSRAEEIELTIWWQTDDPATTAMLAVMPEDGELDQLELTYIKRPVRDDAGYTQTEVAELGARYEDLKPSCDGEVECTLRFLIAPKPSSGTTAVPGRIIAETISRGPLSSLCEATREFPAGAEVTFTFEPIDEAMP
jgi:hypothetical protein